MEIELPYDPAIPLLGLHTKETKIERDTCTLIAGDGMKHQHCRVVWIFIFLTLASYSCFILYPLHNNLQGKLPSTMIQRLYSVQVQGEITFTLTYLLQLRLCFGELPYQLRIRLSQGLLLLRNQRNILVCKKCSFSMGTNRILSWTSRLQECSALVESLVCKHFSTFLIPCSLHQPCVPRSVLDVCTKQYQAGTKTQPRGADSWDTALWRSRSVLYWSQAL